MLQRLWKSITRSLAPQSLRQTLGMYPLRTLAGIDVNEATALRLGAVFASIRVISETRGSLPIRMYELSKSGRRSVVTQHPVAQLLNGEPNPDMTPMVWSETATAHVLGWGNSYSELAWGDRGELQAIIPRHPSLVTPYRDSSGDLMYRIGSDAGERQRDLDRSQMLHVPGMGGNGIVGWSVIRLGAASIGLGLAQDEMAQAHFGNKAKPGLVVTVPGALDDAKFAALQSNLNSNYQGEGAFRALLLEGGMQATPISIPANEAQLLESREFQGEEIACRWFRLPPHVVGYLRRANFANIEQQDLYFEKHTMRPWLVRFEQELNRKLFSRSEWGRFFVKHNVDALLRADIKTRYEAHKSAILSGWKSRNEVRELEDLDPVEGLDSYRLPEAIFGKSGAAAASPPKAGSSRRQIDTRLVALTDQVLSGLLQREVVAIQRASAKPSFTTEVVAFYERHLPLIVERLKPLACSPAPAIAVATARRDAVSAMSGEQARSVAEAWTTDGLAEQLLGA